MNTLAKTLFFSILAVSLTFQVKAQHTTSEHPYVEEVFDLLESNSILADSVDFDKRKQEFYDNHDVSNLNDSTLYNHLAAILKEFKHHRFVPPSKTHENRHKNKDSDRSVEFSSSKFMEEDNIGYLRIPMFLHSDSTASKNFADTLQSQIKDLSNKGVKNWIVDLRNNHGGNMWPMLAGVGELFENHDMKLGAFYSNSTEEYYPWFYKKGKSYYMENDSVNYMTSIDKFYPVETNKIAVLINDQSASSAEAVAIAFKGNERAKIFGQRSATYTTANEHFELSDGASLIISTTIMADRFGDLYPNGIVPDVTTDEGKEITAAKQWLSKDETG